jgi:hypothetical protein
VRSRRALLALPLLLALLGACGGEKTFSEEEFIEAVNSEGAALELGEVITTNQDGVDVRAVSFSEDATSPTGAEGGVHGGGTMLVLPDAGAATEELDRCETAPSLTCFRAANVVLRFEEIFPEEQARVTAAFEAIASE